MPFLPVRVELPSAAVTFKIPFFYTILLFHAFRVELSSAAVIFRRQFFYTIPSSHPYRVELPTAACTFKLPSFYTILPFNPFCVELRFCSYIFGPKHRRTAPAEPNSTALWSYTPQNCFHRTKSHGTLVLDTAEPPLQDQIPRHFGPGHCRTAPAGPNITSLWSWTPLNRFCRTKHNFTLVLDTAEPPLQDQTLRHFGPKHRRTAPGGPNISSLWSWTLQNRSHWTKRNVNV